MAELITDPEDARLGHGVDTGITPQHDAYLILSDAERAKGYVRPVRRTYTHVGRKPKNPLRELTEEEHERYDKFGYVMYEEYPKTEDSSVVGRFWTQKDLDSKGCGVATTMSQQIAETYARNPHFYGSTYCVGCQKHLEVEEFAWDDGTVVGE